MKNDQWFYEMLTEEFGPVPVEQIQQLISDGTLDPTDRVRRESDATWITVEQLTAFSRQLDEGDDSDDEHELDGHEHDGHQDRVDEADLPSSSDPGDLTDLSELSFHFEESTAESDDTAAADERHLDLEIDSFNLQGDSDSPLPEVPERPREPAGNVDNDPDDAEEQWYVESLGELFGPMPFDEVIEMVRAGTLSARDEIRQGADGRWVSIGGMRDLVSELPPTEDSETAAAGTAGQKRTDRNSETSSRPGRKRSSGVKEKSVGRKKRKKKKKEDLLLKEIFTELFDEDGQVRQPPEQPAAGAAAAVAPLPADGVPPVAAAGASSAQPAYPQAQTPGQPMAAAPPQMAPPQMAPPQMAPPQMAPPQDAASAANAAAAAMSSGAAQTPYGSTAGYGAAAAAPRPPAYTPKKTKKSSGAGFQLPEPKVLGIAGGGLVVVLVIALAATGVISFPGFSTDTDPFFTEFEKKYASISAGSISQEDWKKFQLEFGPTARKYALEFMPKAGSSAHAKQVADTLTAVFQLMALAHDDQAKQSEIFERYKKLRAGN
ncbi:MAG: GYF domain-containing protein [Fuerstiella sp.]